MSRFLITAIIAWPIFAHGGEVELAGMKSTAPADWKEEPPSNTMRVAQFKLPKADGDPEDAELALFTFPGGSGSLEANLKRQLDKFADDGRKEKTNKIQVGRYEATYQDVSGTYKKKPFPMATNFTAMPNYRQLYVVFEDQNGRQHYMTLLGPAKTIEKNKASFETWLKNFK